LNTVFLAQSASVGLERKNRRLLQVFAVKNGQKLVFRQNANDLIVFNQNEVKTVFVSSKYPCKKLH